MSLVVDDDDAAFQADLARAIASSLGSDIGGSQGTANHGGPAGWNALLAAGQAAAWGNNRGDAGRCSPALLATDEDEDDDFQRQIAAAMAASIQSAEEDRHRRKFGFGPKGHTGAKGLSPDMGLAEPSGGTQEVHVTAQPHAQGQHDHQPQQQQSLALIPSHGAVCCSSGLLLKPLAAGRGASMGTAALPASPLASAGGPTRPGVPPPVGPMSWPWPSTAASAGAATASMPQHLPAGRLPSPCPSGRNPACSPTSSAAGSDAAACPCAAAAPAPAAADAAAAGLLSSSPGKHARTPSLAGATDSVQPLMKRSRAASDSGGASPSTSESGGLGRLGTTVTGFQVGAGAPSVTEGRLACPRACAGSVADMVVGEDAAWETVPAHSHSPPERPASAASGCTAAAGSSAAANAAAADGPTCAHSQQQRCRSQYHVALLYEHRSNPAAERQSWADDGDVELMDASGTGGSGGGGGAPRSSGRCGSWPPAGAVCGSAGAEGPHQQPPKPPRSHHHTAAHAVLGGVEECPDAAHQPAEQQGRYTLDLSSARSAVSYEHQHWHYRAAGDGGRQADSQQVAKPVRRYGSADGGPRGAVAPLDLSRPGQQQLLKDGPVTAGAAAAAGGSGSGSLVRRSNDAAEQRDVGPVPMATDPVAPASDVGASAAVEDCLPGAAAAATAIPPHCGYSAADRRMQLHQRVWWWLGPGQVQAGRISSIDRRSEPLLYTVRLDAAGDGGEGDTVIATPDCLLPYLSHGDRVMCRLPPPPEPQQPQCLAAASWSLAGADVCSDAAAAGPSCSWQLGTLQHCMFEGAAPMVHVLLGAHGLPYSTPYECVVPVEDVAEGSGCTRAMAGADYGSANSCMYIVAVGPPS